ncbi:S8 family serine peptidase [Corynebacterium hansenii]|uniref:S8 family serine peptidase n=1 Tax=Corynebacterium hansenii TaxID=394964 RepID=A0ABV7ZPG1_9CORY|nr:S8 family serine peptidase [Corynebacterium hansenii]WJY99042.1 Thermophilic serine proteinase precursor [Corynebacterium hansenii]
MSRRLRAAAWSAGLLCFATAIVGAPQPAAQTRCTEAAASSTAILSEPTGAERALRFRDAWPLADGAGITIAIIDTGVADHPRLGGVVDGGDVTGGEGAFHDCDAHGTFVAGLAAGRPGADSIAGVAPGATVLSIRHTTGDEGTLLSLATAIDSAVAQGARVINISLTSCAPPGAVPPGAPDVAEAVRGADDAGSGAAVTGANGAGSGAAPAAGNDGEAVAAGYAVTAEWVDVAAPGGPVAGPAPDGETMADLRVTGSRAAPIVGTSFAAPLVSGTAALILSRHPALSPAEVREIIAATSSPVASTPGIGIGVVDPVAAVNWAGAASPGAPAGAAPPHPPPRPDPVPGSRVRILFLGAVVSLAASALWAAGSARSANRGGRQ